MGLGAIGPCQLTKGGLVLRAVVLGGGRQDTGWAFDHDVSGIAGGRSNQGYPSIKCLFNAVVDKEGAGKGLTKATAGIDIPDVPIRLLRLKLLAP